MKKRINTIDGKILVQGGTDNELKSNEIRVNADKTLTERVDGKIVSAGGSGSGVVDNPDDYEQTLTLFVVNKDNSSQTFTLEEIVNPTADHPLFGWEPIKMVITFYYLKNGVPFKFVPNDFKIRIKSDVNDSITDCNEVYFEVVDGTIVIETLRWAWGVADSALILWRKGELVFTTVVNWT